MTKAKEPKTLVEIRVSLIKKELVTDKDGNVVLATAPGKENPDGVPLEKHTEHTHFEITDQDLCAEISSLLGDAISKEHVESVPKDKDDKPIFDAHKFVLDGKKPEKKTPAA